MEAPTIDVRHNSHDATYENCTNSDELAQTSETIKANKCLRVANFL
jgi:hypothetical protein